MRWQGSITGGGAIAGDLDAGAVPSRSFSMQSWDCSSTSSPWSTRRSSFSSLRLFCISLLLKAASLFSSSD